MIVRKQFRRVVLAAGAALALTAGGIAYAAGVSSVASCVASNPSPSMTTSADGSSVSFTSGVTCTATLPVTTVTVTAPPSSSTTTPPPSTTSTPPVTTSSSTTASSPPPTGTGWVRPTAASTGFSGSLVPWSGSYSPTLSNQTISNTDFGSYLKLAGSNIVLDNCHLQGLAFYGPGPLTLRHCTIDGSFNSDSYYRAISGVTLDHVHVICADHDGIDVFGSGGHIESNVSITDTLVDGMNFPAGSLAHGDGLQIRGVNGLTVTRAVFNDGPYQSQDNSAIYFENVNGGDSNMHLLDLDLYGGGYTFYTNGVASSTATNVAVVSSGHWGPYHANVHPSGWAFSNVTNPSGGQILP